MNDSNFGFYKDIIQPNLFLLGIFGACLVIGVVSIVLFGKNNPVERAVESVIAEETGLVVDLSASVPPK